MNVACAVVTGRRGCSWSFITTGGDSYRVMMLWLVLCVALLLLLLLLLLYLVWRRVADADMSLLWSEQFGIKPSQ